MRMGDRRRYESGRDQLRCERLDWHVGRNSEAYCAALYRHGKWRITLR
jgi:hypothetical protein